jgi:hypothetical protein
MSRWLSVLGSFSGKQAQNGKLSKSSKWGKAESYLAGGVCVMPSSTGLIWLAWVIIW